MDTDLNTSVKGLHCLGDSSGWTRGLMMASVMGVLMGRRIAGEDLYNIYNNTLSFYKSNWERVFFFFLYIYFKEV